MRVHFLLGPAGSGKTSRCLEEVRRELEVAQGPPLLFLAPKQSTFQLERQILSGPQIAAYTRLQILSFERLAALLLDNLGEAPPRLLEEEGRLMVLRALLMDAQADLRVFRATARLPGFARQLSLVLRECQRARITPGRLEELSRELADDGPLGAKLSDLGRLLRAYLEWLASRRLQDAAHLIDVAMERLRDAAEAGRPLLHLGAVWLDGFAEMTPQELELLAAVTPLADRVTLAFCLDHLPQEDPSWLSTWSVVGQSFRRCWHRLSTLPGVELSVEILPREGPTRFASAPALAHLERHWASSHPAPFANPGPGDSPPSAPAFPVRLVRCANPECEAVLAAREVLQHVRDRGGRYREVAVLVRSLDSYHAPLRRAFTRYGIPFFLDRREPVGHHPVAELTRSALRLAALGWQHEDLFSALKSGLVPLDEQEVDWLENAALANGWHGPEWMLPLVLRSDRGDLERAEGLRQRIARGFAPFCAHFSPSPECRPTGPALAAALRTLWETLEVPRQVDSWSERPEVRFGQSGSLHQTVWDQVQSWVRNLELAFDGQALPLREWLPILEAGLGSLTVGVIPPSLDQVLIGTVDRSRNPELKVAVVLGMNESVFPAPPGTPRILTEAERNRLAAENLPISLGRRRQLGHERYYGYIACTRASERAVVAWSAATPGGDPLNPSPFIAHLHQMFGSPAIEEFDGRIPWSEAGHPTELASRLLQSLNPCDGTPAAELLPPGLVERLAPAPPFAMLVDRHRMNLAARSAAMLPPGVAAALYGTRLVSSVSALEDYAACPFRFFVARGLQARERELHEVDDRHRGTFQHELLRAFHEGVTAAGLRWRDLSLGETALRVDEAGARLLESYRGGLFLASPAARLVGERLIDQTRLLLGELVRWMGQYQFDPVAVELGFGMEDGGLPGWTIPLSGERSLLLRGRIDRVDLHLLGGGKGAYVNVVDYKSSKKTLDPLKLENGLQLQLLSYLAVLERLPDPGSRFGVGSLQATGAFYVRLGMGRVLLEGRGTAPERTGEEVRKAHRHHGRFNREHLGLFDSRPGAGKGDQFVYAKTKDGGFAKRGNDGLPGEAFHGLVEEVVRQLQLFGEEIYQGCAVVSPYATSTEQACRFCDFRPVCRFDPWLEEFRLLRRSTGSTADEGEES